MKLSVANIATMSDGALFDLLCKLRWPETDGEPVCPKCGTTGAYEIRSRTTWRCLDYRKCCHNYTLTSGTIFAHRKLSLKSIVLGAALFTGGAKGISACQVSRYLGVDYRTAFVLCHKFRELVQRPYLRVNGIVEIDGCTIGGHRVASNQLSARQEKGRNTERKRLYRLNAKHRRVIVGIREKYNAEMKGPGRTRCFVVRKESEGVNLVKYAISETSVVHADMAHAWNSMKKLYTLLQVCHSQEAYVSNEGVHTNNIESFWSLLRRMHNGTHHRMDAENLGAYANELCWRQDHRHLSEHDRIAALLRLALTSIPSRKWTGYWQLHHREEAQTGNLLLEAA